jgi:hypothetical protein
MMQLKQSMLLLCNPLITIFVLRASPAMNPTRPPAALFFIQTVKNGSVAPPVPCFRPDLGFHPSGKPRSSPAPRGALEESGGNKCVGNAEESFRASGGPDLSARKGGRRPHRIVFRAL